MTTASKHPPTGALVAPPYVTKHTLHKVSLVIDFYDHCNVYVIISKQVFDNIVVDIAVITIPNSSVEYLFIT